MALGLIFRCRSWCRAFAIGLTLDDELVGAVAETIQSALRQHRLVKDRHPFLHTSVGGDDGGTACVPFDQQIIEVGSGLSGKFLEGKIIDDEQIGSKKTSQLAVEAVVGAGEPASRNRLARCR